MPILAISNFSFKLFKGFSFDAFKMMKRITVENNTRYQVKSPSFKVISLPKTPVKPANTTAICSMIYDFFIKIVLPKIGIIRD
ncbi:hypothetical protein D3C85_1301330 [compost metagenome]